MKKPNDIEQINYYKALNWSFKKWEPSPALIDKNGFASHQFLGQSFDQKYFTIDPKGWTHDHCELCTKTFCEDSGSCETKGFVSDNLWLCSNCYDSLIKTSE